MNIIAYGPRRAKTSLQGFTLLEVIIASSIFAMMFVVVFALLGATRTMTRTGETQVDVQEFARRALEKVTADLRRTGRTTKNTLTYPRFGNFSNTPSTTMVSGRPLYTAAGINPIVGCGVPIIGLKKYGNGYFDHAGVTPAQKASQSAEWRDVSREVIYLLPDDTAATTVDPVTGTVAFVDIEIALIVDRDPLTGINYLYKKYHPLDGSPNYTEGIAEYVDRIVVEDCGNLPDPDGVTAGLSASGVPIGLTTSQLRVTIWMGRPLNGSVIQSKFSCTIMMRNNTLSSDGS